MLVTIYEVTLCHVPEESKLNISCCKNLKTHTLHTHTHTPQLTQLSESLI
jgi:hypothetical protein